MCKKDVEAAGYPSLALGSPPCAFWGVSAFPAVVRRLGLLAFPCAVGWSVCVFLPFLSWGCCRVFFFCCLPFSFSSLLCRVVSACGCCSPRLVCVFLLRPCLGRGFFAAAGVSRWSVVACSCVGVGCLSPRCSCVWCACLPRRAFWLVSRPLVLRRGSGFFACLGGLAPVLPPRLFPCCLLAVGVVCVFFRLSSWWPGSPPLPGLLVGCRCGSPLPS